MGRSGKVVVAVGVVAVAVAAFLLLQHFADGEKPRSVKPSPPPSLHTEPAPTPAPAPEPVEPEQDPQPEEPELVEPAPRPPAKRRRIPAAKTAPGQAKEPELTAVLTVKDTKPPQLRVISPRDRSYLMEELVTVRVRSEAGATVRIEEKTLLETAAGLFVAQVTLNPGRNQLGITAEDAVGNRSETILRITYIDPGRYRRFKDRLTALLGQLTEVRQASDEINQRMEEIILEISNTGDAEKVNRLSRKQTEVRRARRVLQQEIEKAMQEIDSILAKK